ncbi:EAL domain-containing protein [Sulfurihydrogenibium azorense]|uniref:EAL domain-containing protein n=1 Tax=Sulfurihydrogenibium azorense TaxID=309806 RepID=UPI00391B00BC
MTEIDSIIDNLYFVYQPIANIRTGEIFGYEALIRGFDKLGFKNPHELFDYLSKNNLLFKVDIKLREKVILEFLDNFNLGHRLFYNLDSRIISDVNYKEGETIRILQNYNVPKNLLVFEVSERFSVDKASLSAIIKNYKQQGFELALDDFGVGSVCLLEAIDKNPLTKLPGNISIKKYIDQNLNNQEEFFAVYFDFNNFKPFNDYYGFRRGDRSILMFSEILKSNFHSDNFFIGHVGGDDFFLGSKDIDYESLYSKVKFVVEKFNHDVISLYDRDDIEKGYIVSRDRNGVERKFEFLTVSAAIVYIPKGKKLNQSVLDEIIAQAKKEAKEQKKYIQSVCLLKTTIKEFEWTS